MGEVSMIDRVARAIVASRNLPESCDVNWEGFRRDARAAIEEMHVPTEVMKIAGCDADDPLGGLVDWRGPNTTTRDVVEHVYSSMIDAALKAESTNA